MGPKTAILIAAAILFDKSEGEDAFEESINKALILMDTLNNISDKDSEIIEMW